MTRGVAWLIAAVLLVGFAVYNINRTTVAEMPLPVLYTLGGDFRLESTRGGALSLSDLEGELVLLNFGFTGCPDVCPTALARMRDVLGLLGDRRLLVKPLFVTLDPEVDTLDRIGPYVGFFDSAFIGLTGTPEQVARAAEVFKVYYERVPIASTAGYTINHSSHIYLIDSEGRVRATFGEGIPVAEIANAVRRLADETGLRAQAESRRGST